MSVQKPLVSLVLTCLVLTSAGCGSSQGVEPDGKDGSGTAVGMVDGRGFDTVADARWIGAPDDPKQTRVIYVFDKQVSCSALSAAGWDEAVTDKTQALEMKLIGTSPGMYAVSTRPATGEADVNYTLTSTSGTPSEVSATAGNVTVDQFLGKEAADGSFDLTIPNGAVSGTFHATYCATGREP
jgi:hypothetical protein